MKYQKNKSIINDLDKKKEIILKSSNLNENQNEEKNNDKLNNIDENKDNIIINKEEKVSILKNININRSNKFNKEINLLLKSRTDFSNKAKDNKIEGITSNWNHASNVKLNTHGNDYYLYKNKFIKSTPLKDKLINDLNKNKMNTIILPDIKTPNIHRENINLKINNNNNNNISDYSKSPQDIFSKNNNELYSDNTNIYKNIKINNVISTNNNYLSYNNTPTTTIATNSSKKFISSKIKNNPNLNEDQYGMGLISGASTTNNNIIIPILTIKHPANKFNSGGGMIHNINDKENTIFNSIGINKKTDNNENNIDLFNICKYKNLRSKICKSQEIKGRINYSMKNKEIYNLLPGMQKLIIPNFHKIKIEKGMTNINLGIPLTTKKHTNFQNYESKLKKIL